MLRNSVAASSAALGLFLAVACGGSNSNEIFGPGGPTGDPNKPSGSSSGNNASGSSGTASGSSSGDNDPNKPPACSGGLKTTLSGTVYDPATANPLPHVVVYVPQGPLAPISDSLTAGISCETCADVTVNAVAKTITDANGHFTLEDVPVGNAVPLVVQVGKWRREIPVQIAKPCDANEVPDKTLRLPRKSSEGSMPHIAVTSGACDALECMLRGVGIDDSEFVSGASGAGHVHVFKGDGGKMGADAATQLWNDAEALKKFDVVLLSCECDEHEENKGGTTPGARASMHDYLEAGGRVLASHYQYVWFKSSPYDDFKQLASWTDGFGSGDGDYDVDTTFPKGAAMADWLKATNASSIVGKLPLKAVRSSVQSLNAPARAWVSKPQDGAKFFSANTPISAAAGNQCGRLVFSDLHITDASGPSTINSCPISAGGLNGQQKALEYFFFDVTSCVQDDALAPSVPGP